ncbi:MAG: hypothetical protein ACP5NS_03935 [Candidatus Pacearchaeota archaeon]
MIYDPKKPQKKRYGLENGTSYEFNGLEMIGPGINIPGERLLAPAFIGCVPQRFSDGEVETRKHVTLQRLVDKEGDYISELVRLYFEPKRKKENPREIEKLSERLDRFLTDREWKGLFEMLEEPKPGQRIAIGIIYESVDPRIIIPYSSIKLIESLERK